MTDGSRVKVCVAALGASSCTFACATLRQMRCGQLDAATRALVFIGGVSWMIVLDNLIVPDES